MNLKLFRLLSIILLIRILYTHQYILVAYWAALLISVEFLNTRKQFNGRIKTYNLLFFVYLLFITGIRTIGTSKNQTLVYTINVFEHLVFALIISFKIHLYLLLLKDANDLKEMTRFWLCAFFFNVVGFINEVYQNLAKNADPFKFSFGSKVDMVVNIVGSLVFVLIAYLLTRRGRNVMITSA